MDFDRGFWLRLYIGGVVFCFLAALVLNLFIGVGFVGPDYPGAPGPWHGPHSPLDGVTRGEYGVWDAIMMVGVLYFMPYVVVWTIAFAVFLVGLKVVKWIAGPTAHQR